MQKPSLAVKSAASLLLLQLAGVSYAAPAIFGPSGCDFSVVFPTEYRSKKIIKGRLIGVLATARPNENVSLSAECWPSENISVIEFAAGLEARAQQAGIDVSAVTSESTPTGNVVLLSGRMSVQGKRVQVRLISYFGPKHRLDLRILDFDVSGSKEHISFRNSVRLK